MFDDWVSNLKMGTMVFGERKINSLTVANGFAKWLTKRWKYMPYLNFSNPVLSTGLFDDEGNHYVGDMDIPNTDEYINKKTYYIERIQSLKLDYLNYSFKWLYDGATKWTYINFINSFLNQINYKMSDADKVWVALLYVIYYCNYQMPFDYIQGIIDHNGVCADYASSMALLLNFIIKYSRCTSITNDYKYKWRWYKTWNSLSLCWC